MKPILIFFYGDSNTGKTNVLKRLGEWFYNRCTEYIELRKGSDSTDLQMAIRYKMGVCRIGIGTSGDDIQHVKDNLAFFKLRKYFPSNECRIFITAARKPHSDSAYQNDADMVRMLKRFSCIDIARNVLTGERHEDTVNVKLVREDELFVYLQALIQTKKRLDSPKQLEQRKGSDK